MSGFSVQVDSSEVDAALRHMLGRLSNKRPAFLAIGQAVVTATDQTFRGQRDPWGQAWKALSASTLAGRRKGKGPGGHKILRDTGRLANSINARATQDHVTVGTNVEYAAIHQFGGTIRHGARTGTLYFRQNKRTGQVGNRFVRASRANFAQDVAIRAHDVTIPARPFLPIRNGKSDLPGDLLADILDILRNHLRPSA